MTVGERNKKMNLTGVPETMLQTIYARAKESKGRGAAATSARKRRYIKKPRKSSADSITIFRLRTKIPLCTAALLPAPLCWIV